VTRPRALLVDDDPWALRWLAASLAARFPELEVVARDSPDVSGAFDLYLVDNDFAGRRLAGELAATIRRRRPGAFVMAVSSDLDRPTLKALVNAGCQGACVKSDAQEVEEALQAVGAYLQARSRRGGVADALRAIEDLLVQWNGRLAP